jgi:flagellar motor switch protein FliN/FliY
MASNNELAFLHDIPIDLVVELGRTSLSVRELSQLEKDDVIELNRLVNEPLDILAGGQAFARGEVVVVDDRVGLRITELIDRAGSRAESA